MVLKKTIYLNYQEIKNILYDQEPSIYQTQCIFFNGNCAILSKWIYTQLHLFTGDRVGFKRID
jgi:hypothetical protein